MDLDNRTGENYIQHIVLTVGRSPEARSFCINCLAFACSSFSCSGLPPPDGVCAPWPLASTDSCTVLAACCPEGMRMKAAWSCQRRGCGWKPTIGQDEVSPPPLMSLSLSLCDYSAPSHITTNSPSHQRRQHYPAPRGGWTRGRGM